jgi:hypothetical protein
LLDIQVKALHTDKPIAIDGAGKLNLPEDAMEVLDLNSGTTHPGQDLSWGAATIFAIAMRPMRSRIEGLNKLGMQALHVFKRGGMLKLIVSQAQLDLKLCLNQILPGFAFLNVVGGNV